MNYIEEQTDLFREMCKDQNEIVKKAEFTINLSQQV